MAEEDLPPQPRLVPAIDVSSYQPADLIPLIATYHPEHVVVRLYLPWERVSQDHSREQITSAIKAGCTVGGYCWLYADVSPSATVIEALKLARSVELELPVLWLDVETYTDGSIPSKGRVAAATFTAQASGVRAGLYSSNTMLTQIGYPASDDAVWYWAADYNGQADLELPGYGGLRLVGHQYSDKAPDGAPLDMSVFLEEATRRDA